MWTTSSAPVSSSQGMSPVGSSRKFTMDWRRDQCMLRYIIITQLSSSFLQINEHKISCPSMIELSLEFWCLIYSLKTCSIKSPFVFQYINKKFLFFCQLIISLLHSTTLIAYYIKPFKKWTMFLQKKWNKSYTHRVKPYLCDHFSVIIFVKISTSVKKKYKILN